METEQPKLDTNALSRQLAVYGAETQGKLMTMNVFLIGVRGLGIEIAKNLILAGPKSVHIYDPNPVTLSDLGSNFYLRPEHVGKTTRAEAVMDQLANLNPAVNVKVAPTNEIDTIIKHYSCVVVTDFYDKTYLTTLNEAARVNNIGFIYSGNLGLYGFTFVDFGENHRVHDTNGEATRSAIIVGIENSAEGLVFSHEDKRHGFEDGDTVVFKEVRGMTEVNDQQFKIKVKSPFSFSIGDTSSFNMYECNGIAEQVKIPVFMKFKSLQQALDNPFAPGKRELDLCTWDKIGRAEQLHIILNALLTFVHTHKRLPRDLDENDANELVTITKTVLAEINGKNNMEIEGEQSFKVESVNEDIIRNVSRYANAQISPVCSFWGGIVTQEIVKLTGKYSPLRQWLHHDFLEILPEGNIERGLPTSRYNDYAEIFGRDFIEKAGKVNTFLVGAGALGCEFIKMFSLMGLGTHGKITCTDDDNIEISNLNRQFLFRKENVGGNKSEVACAAGKRMNPEVNFNSTKLRVDPENEEYFNDQFWDSLDFVVNAVDNVKARLYVDSRCVWYGKVLFESGTLGTKCNSQVVIPKYTQSYGDSQDPAEETIPLCTLKNFPYQIEHTIQWARDYFEGVFVEGPLETSKFFENPKEYLQKTRHELKSKTVAFRQRLETIKKLLDAQQKRSYEACVELARHMFQDIFYNQIAQLLTSFPLDHQTQNGKLFWSGLKRPPTPIAFNSSDKTHIEFVQSAANIFAHIFGLPLEHNVHAVATIADSIPVPEFKPRKVVIKTQENKNDEPEQKEEEDEEVIVKLEKELSSMNINRSGMWNVIEFEKDDPTNFHIEAVASISNLRARNYKIDEVDNFRVKLIAGKIIPAIATTTAMVVGAVGVEIIKKILGAKNELYKNSFMNLALPLWVFSDPLPPIEATDKEYDEILLGPVKAIPPKHTTWDKIHVKGPLTLAQFKKYFEEHYKVSLSMVSVGQVCIFNKYSQDANKRDDQDILHVYETVSKKKHPAFKKYMQIEANGETLADGVDAVMPSVKYQVH